MINRMVWDSFIELFICFGMSTITSIFQNELKRGAPGMCSKKYKGGCGGRLGGSTCRRWESGCSDSCSEYEIQRLIINNDCNFCGVTKILDKEVTMSGFSTFTLERNCISLNFSVSILFLNQDVPFCLSEKRYAVSGKSCLMSSSLKYWQLKD